MNARASREGFALVFVLILLTAVGLTVGAVMTYVGFANRMTRLYLAKSRCRFAAQSALEYAKARVQKGFAAVTGGSTATAVKIDPRQAEVYNWFDTVSGDRRTIGIADAKHPAVRLDEGLPETINGCSLAVAVGRDVQHPAGQPYASVPIVATAVYVYPDGLEVSATLWERIVFGTGQSPVFDYAYFVNNYGWMNGSGIIINGDMRANGDVSLTKSTINGFIYAAANDEVGASGVVSLSSPRIQNQSSYRQSSATTQSRYDVGDYADSSSFDAPNTATTIARPQYDANGNIISGTVAAKSGDPIVNDNSVYADNVSSLPMPFVSELSDYVEYAREKDGSLSYGNVTFTDGTGASRTQSGGTVSAHYSGTGPSGQVGAADQGALVLVGTKTNPIRIDGPVVIDSDVIIKGYVTGQGTIYSGRNIHIVGDITYLDPPVFTHNTSSAETQMESNERKDMLGLVAKGNVVVGDCSTTTWKNSVVSYINGGSSSVVESYACDASDADIGYAATFAGNYTAVEATGGKRKIRTQTSYEYQSVPTYNWYGQVTGYRNQRVTVKELVSSADRKYYETCCDDAILTSLAGSGIARIDAIVYNNHGLFGTLGKSNQKSYFNGSAVCRDEALIMTTGNGLVFNWDQRLRRKNGNAATAAVALPVGPQEPYVLSWQEVADAMNPALARAKGGTP